MTDQIDTNSDLDASDMPDRSEDDSDYEDYEDSWEEDEDGRLMLSSYYDDEQYDDDEFDWHDEAEYDSYYDDDEYEPDDLEPITLATWIKCLPWTIRNRFLTFRIKHRIYRCHWCKRLALFGDHSDCCPF